MDLDLAYLEELREEFPRLRLVDKRDSPFSKLVARALVVLTLGGQDRFLTHYVTTIGQTIFLPRGWEDRTADSRYVILRHEAVHLRQFRRYGFLLTAFLYLVPIVPLGLAWGRARLEWEAYAESIRATAEVHGLEAARDPAFHAFLVDQFTTSAYGWMWPFPRQVRRWIDEEVAALDA